MRVAILSRGNQVYSPRRLVEAAELSGQFYNNSRPGIAALSLTTNTSNLTAISNDFDFDMVFSRQLEGLL